VSGGSLQGFADGNGQGGGGVADQAAELAAVVVERALARLDIPAGDGLGQGFGQAEAGQGGGVVGAGQILVGQRLASLARDLGGEIAERPGCVARQFIGPARLIGGGQDDGGGFGIVGAGGGGNPAVARAADEGPARQSAADRAGIVLGVPAVAQDDMGQARGLESVFGLAVFVGEVEARGRGVKEAGVDDQLDAGAFGGVDDVLVLGCALADVIAGDQQEFVDASEGRVEAGGVGVVGLAGGDAEVRGFGGVADEGDDLGGGDLFGQALDDEAARWPVAPVTAIMMSVPCGGGVSAGVGCSRHGGYD